MAQWPNGDDTKRWLRDQSFGASEVDAAVLDEVTAAAREEIEAQLDVEFMPDPDGDPEKVCPESVRTAIMMRAAALFVRRSSPNGVIQVTPDQAIRVSQYDADIEKLIRRYRADCDPVI